MFQPSTTKDITQGDSPVIITGTINVRIVTNTYNPKTVIGEPITVDGVTLVLNE